MVTGASRGLGTAMAVALGEAGADVILVARGDLSAAQLAVQATGRRVWTFKADQAQSVADKNAKLQEKL